MHYRRTRPPLAVLLAVLLLAPATAGSSPVLYSELPLPATSLSEEQKKEQKEEQKIVHALNRLAYGPRPGEVERVKAMGLERWIAQQLAPETLPDEGMQKRLAGFDTLRMLQKDLMIAYPPPLLLRGIERQLTTRAGMDPDSVTDLFPELEEMRQRRRRQEQQREGAPAENQMGAGEEPEQARPDRMQRARYGPNRILMELSQAKLLRAIYSERQLEEIMVDFWFNHFNVFIGKGTERWLTTGYERDAIRPHALGNFRDLLGATARHPAMLFYLDNWQSASPEASQDQRSLGRAYTQAARAAGLPRRGVVEELLRQRGIEPQGLQRRTRQQRQRGTRRSGSQQVRRPQNRQEPFRARRQRKRGLNENYARELLELHTLGVDGGYTQQDVIAVARCFTGWTLTPLAWGQQFVYADALHDSGEKIVLGKTIKNSGEKDGEQVLDLLVKHPATARFIATKLAQRFVSDHPPDSLVEKMAGTFLQTKGDIRAVLRTMFAAEEFWAPETVHAKFKTPLEFLVSAVRATGAEVSATLSATTEDPAGEVLRFVMVLRRLGQPLYGAPPPTGYKETADAWVSSGALLDRMKVALGLATGRLLGPDWRLPENILAADSVDEMVAGLGREVLGRELARETRQVLQGEVNRVLAARQIPTFSRLPLQARERIARFTLGWILASPEFQRQ